VLLCIGKKWRTKQGAEVEKAVSKAKATHTTTAVFLLALDVDDNRSEA